jgi:putative endonuclease
VIAKRDRLVVICEVKARASDSHGIPAEAVTMAKQSRIRRGAVAFIRTTEMSGVNLRFDVACILGTKLEIITDAF